MANIIFINMDRFLILSCFILSVVNFVLLIVSIALAAKKD